MKAEAEETVAGYDKELAKLNAELAKLEATLPKAPEPAAPKFDPEKHPLLKKASEKAEVAKPVVFSTGDLCEAQWTDRQWYKVKIQTVLGSSSDPKYHVRFLDYQDSTLTVGRDAIRPLMNEKKRKAEAVPTTPTTAPATSSHVISGPASMNLQHPANKQATEVDTSVPINRRKIGGAKALERKASSWKDFQKKGPGKMVTKKESMFRTGEGPNSRGMCRFLFYLV
jgi:survival-of-motor-neuron-related-splicing factor 30